MRNECFERDEWTCRACGFYDPVGNFLQGDHIVPVTKGGKNELSNLQTLCGVCNNHKQNTNLKELEIRTPPSMTPALEEYIKMLTTRRQSFLKALKAERMKENRKERA